MRLLSGERWTDALMLKESLEHFASLSSSLRSHYLSSHYTSKVFQDVDVAVLSNLLNGIQSFIFI